MPRISMVEKGYPLDDVINHLGRIMNNYLLIEVDYKSMKKPEVDKITALYFSHLAEFRTYLVENWDILEDTVKRPDYYKIPSGLNNDMSRAKKNLLKAMDSVQSLGFLGTIEDSANQIVYERFLDLVNSFLAVKYCSIKGPLP